MSAAATPRTRISERLLRSIPEDSLPHNTESFKGKDIKRSGKHVFPLVPHLDLD